MASRVSRLGIGVVAVGLLLLSAGLARAGTRTAFAYCSSAPAKSLCYGTLSGFLADSDPNSYASFNTDSSGSPSFNARLGGRDYSCTVSPTLYPDVLALWPRTTSFESFFMIMWDQQGYCSSLSLHNSSAYR